jgi:two-component system, cell cycle response regulator
LRILLAEDDAVTRRLLEKMLSDLGYEAQVCADGAQASEVMCREDPPKLAILDWMMPGKNGIEVCRAIREREQRPYTYVILLTGKGSKQDVLEGLEAGADDYIVKPFDPNELKVRLRAGARIVQLQEDLIGALRLSEFRATHDSLTGLWNRGALLEAIKKELARSEREMSPLGILMADVDHFKDVNDQWGHLTGDIVLHELAERIHSSLRPYDLAGRYGGEEFVVALPGCDLSDAARLAERLRAMIMDSPVETSQGPISCTMSFGVTAVLGGNNRDVDSLLREADAAMYVAKKAGRNRVEVWRVEDGDGENRAATR